MRRFISAFLIGSYLALIIPAAPAAAASADKDLTNFKGLVSYQVGAGGPVRPLGIRARQALNDADSAITGAASLAGIDFPDSTRILVGQNSDVTMNSFALTDMARAKFVVVGKMRFRVVHPQGGQANYTFNTAAGSISVRGTEGDISADISGNLQVNVYSISNPALPVLVTLNNGQVFTLMAGQTLTVTSAGAVLTGVVTTITQAAFRPFVEFGIPSNAAALGLTGPTLTLGGGGGITPTNIIGIVLGAVATGVIIHSTNPAPARSASVTVPIRIH